MTDTTREAVERLASRHTIEADAWASDGAIHDLAVFHRQSANTLLALLARAEAAERVCVAVDRWDRAETPEDLESASADKEVVFYAWRATQAREEGEA